MSPETLLANLVPIANNIIGFIIMITIIVFVHEYGHFYFARLFGVKVETFSIGFGKPIFKWKDKKGTNWHIGWLPMGGYVKMYGDTDGSSKPDLQLLDRMTQKEREESFFFKALWKKAIIVFAGPFANFVLALVIVFSLTYSYGIAFIPPVIGHVGDDTPAARAGLERGDIILKFDDKEVSDFKDLMNFLLLNNGQSITLTIDRHGEILYKNILPQIVEREDGFGSHFSVSMIGITPTSNIERRDLGIWQSFTHAVHNVYVLSHMTLSLLGQMLVGDKGLDGMSGPIKIARFSGKSMSEGFVSLFQLIALISVSLGVVNLLPIPLLDGGHLASYVIRAIYGKPLPRIISSIGYRIAFVFLIGLMSFTIIKDIVELFR